MSGTTEAPAHETGTVASGDVEIFYRRFGGRVGAPSGEGGGAPDGGAPGDGTSGDGTSGGGTPILILHGAGYYDSADWVEVAAALAAEHREVVAFDARGYGKSSWSPSRDYSAEAQLADIGALIASLGWERTVLLGHSRGGSFALRYAARHPEQVAALILADSCPGRNARGAAPEPRPPLYSSLEAALAATSRDPASLESPTKRARLEQIFTQVEGGYALAVRDPAFQSAVPDPWLALEGLRLPVLAIRATRSLSYDDAAAARAAQHAQLVEIDAGHDLANEAPRELLAAVQGFLS